MSNHYNLTRANIKNLDKLATYLESLPEDYEHFNMQDYVLQVPNWNENLIRYMLKNGGLFNNCGSPGCALGHGPSAGITARNGVDIVKDSEGDPKVEWDAYASRFVPYGPDGNRTRLWDFLFGGSWGQTDDTHRGAAGRIRFILAGGRFREDFRCWDECCRKEAMDQYDRYVKVGE